MYTLSGIFIVSKVKKKVVWLRMFHEVVWLRMFLIRLGVVPLVISSKIYLIVVRQWYNLKNKGTNKRESTCRRSTIVL